MNSRARLATAAAAAAALSVTALTGCSNGPLDTKCEEFLTLSASAQRDIVLAWEKDNNFGDGRAARRPRPTGHGGVLPGRPRRQDQRARVQLRLTDTPHRAEPPHPQAVLDHTTATTPPRRRRRDAVTASPGHAQHNAWPGLRWSTRVRAWPTPRLPAMTPSTVADE